MKRFILAPQPHEVSHRAEQLSLAGRRTTALSFCLVLVFLCGAVVAMTTPDVWIEKVRVGLLKYAYGWQTSPLISQSEATTWYTDITGKAPKSGCKDARLRDWGLVCPIIQTQGMMIDCGNANIEGKNAILDNIQTSKTTNQYACLYEN